MASSIITLAVAAANGVDIAGVSKANGISVKEK
jgi:hypothetical protein